MKQYRAPTHAKCKKTGEPGLPDPYNKDNDDDDDDENGDDKCDDKGDDDDDDDYDDDEDTAAHPGAFAFSQ